MILYDKFFGTFNRGIVLVTTSRYLCLSFHMDLDEKMLFFIFFFHFIIFFSLFCHTFISGFIFSVSNCNYRSKGRVQVIEECF